MLKRKSRRQLQVERDDELHEYIRTKLRLYIPRKAVCPEHQAPFDFVADAYFERESDLLALGPRSGGKTIDVAVLNVLDAAHKGVSIFHLAGSLLQAQRCYEYSSKFWYMDPELEDRLEKEPLMHKTKLKGGANYEILPASSTAVRGPHAPRVRLDEIEEIPDDVWDAAMGMDISQDGVESQTVKTSTRHKGHGRMQTELDKASERGTAVYRWCIFETMQPCKEDCRKCPIRRDCVGCAGDAECSKCPDEKRCEGRARNADGYLSYRDALKAYRAVDRRVWVAERLCKQPSTEKLVYADFDRVLHNIGREDLPAGLRYSGAVDWGYDNPLVFLRIGEDSADRAFVTGELYKRQLTDAEFARICRKTFPDVKEVAADPSNPGGIKEFKQQGFKVRARASKVKDGLGVVRTALKPPRDENGNQPPPRLYVVVADCPQLCAEFESYENKPGFDEPKKKNDHGCDCIRYWYMNFRKRRSKTVTVSSQESK